MNTKSYKHDKGPNIETTVYSGFDRETFLRVIGEYGKDVVERVEDELYNFDRCSVTVWDGKVESITASICIHNGVEPWRYRKIYEFKPREVLDSREVYAKVRARVEERERKWREERERRLAAGEF